MTQKQPINQITEGVIWKQLLLFFFPILLGTFFQQLYNTIDTVIVGQFVGKAALASVGGSSAQIVALIVGFFTGLSSGASVLIAQYFGARNEHAASDGLHNAYAISIMGGILLGIIGSFATPSMLRLMNTPDEIMQDSVIYLRIYFAGIIFVFLYNMGSSILRAVGDSKHPLYYLVACCLLNIILDVLFVVAFHMGVLGVAVATLISQAFSALLVTRKLLRSDGMLKLSFSRIRFHGSVLKNHLWNRYFCRLVCLRKTGCDLLDGKHCLWNLHHYFCGSELRRRKTGPDPQEYPCLPDHGRTGIHCIGYFPDRSQKNFVQPVYK